MAEVEVATNGFDSDSVVGEGAYGVVYRGVSGEGEVWAVKRAKQGKVDNIAEFRNEVRGRSGEGEGRRLVATRRMPLRWGRKFS